ncbi:MAG: MBL fold metallo-hydrolase, partial [Limnothrix sp.]|nr:MBL fold metallo-hydrolase [Limnothrix sp.]
RPDVAIVPVGGGAKAYNAEEAKRAIESLQPKVVIPSQYRTAAADSQCDLDGLEAFLNLMSGYDIQTLNTETMTLRPENLPPQGTLIRVLRHPV